MPDTPFQSLSCNERLDALRVAADCSGRQAHLLEKDIWVVQTLAALVETPFGGHLTFKGGTSLSKAYRAIRRFSEDLDITYDIRAFVPEIVDNNRGNPIPDTTSQAGKWTEKIKKRLAYWVKHDALTAIGSSLYELGTPPKLRAEEDCIYVTYTPLFQGDGFVNPEVKVEFGARSTGEPHTELPIGCDAAEHLPGIAFPTAHPYVMWAERTFWEKATAIHVFCRQQRNQGERRSRHWHDLVRLDDSGYADKALALPQIAIEVANHKGKFFRAKDSERNWIDYHTAVSGNLQLVPTGGFYQVLAKDYDAMMHSGMLLNSDEKFGHIIQRCGDIQDRANKRPTLIS